MTEYTKRFLAYVTATGAESPEAATARDAELYPGGKMGGFLNWSATMVRRWREETGYASVMGAAEHAACEEWIAKRVEAGDANREP
jgi:hypothetical protein